MDKNKLVVQKDPVALKKGERVSTADMELLLPGKWLTLPAYDGGLLVYTFFVLVEKVAGDF